MEQKEIYINNIMQMQAMAIELAKHLEIRDVITFSGDLGVGKTTFVKFLIQELAKNPKLEVTSPTFNLLHLYNFANLEIWHFDLYRLKKNIDIYELGIEDAFNRGVTFIEWPEIIHNMLPNDRLDIQISFIDEHDTRKYHFSSSTKKWQNFIKTERG